VGGRTPTKRVRVLNTVVLQGNVGKEKKRGGLKINEAGRKKNRKVHMGGEGMNNRKEKRKSR